ncbi:MAG TPA: hypothetical protein VGK74_02290 [Symbiobacteriaceae bacterium]|jgi:hypothetical protein
MATKERKPLTSADLNMLVVAAQIIDERAPWAAFNSTQGYHVQAAALKEMADAAGATIEVKPFGRPEYPWEGSVNFGGIRFYAIMETAQLPIIGYEVPGYVPAGTFPVPIAQTA